MAGLTLLYRFKLLPSSYEQGYPDSSSATLRPILDNIPAALKHLAIPATTHSYALATDENTNLNALAHNFNNHSTEASGASFNTAAQGIQNTANPRQPPPLPARKPSHAKCLAADKNNQYLAANHEKINHKEPFVLLYALEYVEFVVQSSTVELVEYSHPNKGVEDNCVQLEHLYFVRCIKVEERVTGEVEHKTGGKFVN